MPASIHRLIVVSLLGASLWCAGCTITPVRYVDRPVPETTAYIPVPIPVFVPRTVYVPRYRYVTRYPVKGYYPTKGLRVR